MFFYKVEINRPDDFINCFSQEESSKKIKGVLKSSNGNFYEVTLLLVVTSRSPSHQGLVLHCYNYGERSAT